jgi:hypothetical protein
VPQGEWDVVARLGSGLAQSVCLSVNKRAKTVKEIAAEVDAHEEYVGEMAAELSELEVLVSPREGRYILNFIAFDEEDWRKLVARMREPAGETAHRLVDAQKVVRTAYERTPLASSGWVWEDVVWAMNCLIIADRGILLRPASKTLTPPERPGGFSYWLGGYECGPGVPHADGVGWLGTDRSASGMGRFGPSFRTMMADRRYSGYPIPPDRGPDVLRTLVDGPAPEEEILSHFSGDDRDECRSTLAELLSSGLVERANGDGYRLTFPVWREGDSEVLTPVVDEVTKPWSEDLLLPVWSDLNALLDEMGYEHRHDQYELWRDWLCSFIAGEALRFMVKQGTLPELGDSPPAKWHFTAWKGDPMTLMRRRSH